MLIICSGPDTFRALGKVRELEVAFKQKYDAHGISCERIASGKEAVTEVAARAGAISLFATRRLVRTSNILGESSKAQRTTLKKVLAGDQDGFILLTLEEEPPTATVLNELGSETKIVRYDFPALQGKAFVDWALGEARLLNIEDERSVRRIAEVTEGDSWRCFFEMMKLAAYPHAEILEGEEERSIFSFAESYVRGNKSWWAIMEEPDLVKQVLTTFLTQARAGVRVRDGASDGLHPFVARKLKGQNLDEADQALARVLEGFFVQRSGYGDEKDVLGVL
jgi:hypothetical protein